MKILIIEDDSTIRSGLKYCLEAEGYEIEESSTANESLKKINSSDLILLDVNLPDKSGFELLPEIKKIKNVPIIFLTANDLEIDIVSGLESGADDYITKPFSLAVLRARVSAVARRNKNVPASFKSGKFQFNFAEMIFLVDNQPVELSKTEQRLLRLLVENAGQILSRDFLLDRVWQGAEFVEENALSVTIKRLRTKLAGAPIKTVYAIGYLWEKEK